MPRVVIPLLPGVPDVAVAGAASVLSTAHALNAVPGLDVQYCAEEALVRSESGLRVVPALLGFEAVKGADAVIVAASPSAGDLPGALARALRAEKPRLLAGVSGGVLALARGGFLEGRRVVAARALRDEVGKLVEEVQVGPRVLRDGFVLTAAGAHAGTELGLAVVHALADARAAEAVADALEVKGWVGPG